MHPYLDDIVPLRLLIIRPHRPLRRGVEYPAVRVVVRRVQDLLALVLLNRPELVQQHAPPPPAPPDVPRRAFAVYRPAASLVLHVALRPADLRTHPLRQVRIDEIYLPEQAVRILLLVHQILLPANHHERVHLMKQKEPVVDRQTNPARPHVPAFLDKPVNAVHDAPLHQPHRVVLELPCNERHHLRHLPQASRRGIPQIPRIISEGKHVHPEQQVPPAHRPHRLPHRLVLPARLDQLLP